MTKIILVIGILSILFNTIIFLLGSNYLLFNWLSVNVVLTINTFLLLKLKNDNISNGFKISLSFIFPILCLISIILAILSPVYFKDNYYLIGIVLILFIELALYTSVKFLKSGAKIK